MWCSCVRFICRPPVQRARVGPGKPTDSSSSSSVCKYDNNGNQDRVKLSDFNFIMVLGKGSFGKVMNMEVFFHGEKWEPVAGKQTEFTRDCWLPLGDVGWEEGYRWVVRHQNPEEGRGNPGRWCGVHHGWEESPGSVWEASFPHAAALLFPNHGSHNIALTETNAHFVTAQEAPSFSTPYPLHLCPLGPVVFCHGVYKWRRPHVPDPTGRQVQGASCCVSTLREELNNRAFWAYLWCSIIILAKHFLVYSTFMYRKVCPSFSPLIGYFIFFLLCGMSVVFISIPMDHFG